MLLKLDAVVAGYTSPVVGPVSFMVRRGEVVGLRGANGSGKSTLLGLVTGTARRFEGTVLVREGTRVAHHRQRTERPPEIPVRGRELLAVAGADPKACPPLLRDRLGSAVDELSGGQYQLLLAYACLGGPADLVLLDEPSNNLDPASVAALGDLLRHAGAHRGVVVVSHESAFLTACCTRIIEVSA